MTSLQSQYLLCPPLTCNTARTHQQPKMATSGYFTWETGPWQQVKQHQMYQVSDEYRRRQSETVSVKRAYTPTRHPYFDAVLRRGSAMNQDTCCRQEMAVHVSTYAAMRGSQGTAPLRSTISAEEVWWCGVPYPKPEKLVLIPGSLILGFRLESWKIRPGIRLKCLNSNYQSSYVYVTIH
jgi:hypothetical protein